jgi:hypothetical protein
MKVECVLGSGCTGMGCDRFMLPPPTFVNGMLFTCPIPPLGLVLCIAPGIGFAPHADMDGGGAKPVPDALLVHDAAE